MSLLRWAEGDCGHFTSLAKRYLPRDVCSVHRHQFEVVENGGPFRIRVEDEQGRAILHVNPGCAFVYFFRADVLVVGIGKPVQEDVVELLL